MELAKERGTSWVCNMHIISRAPVTYRLKQDFRSGKYILLEQQTETVDYWEKRQLLEKQASFKFTDAAHQNKSWYQLEEHTRPCLGLCWHWTWSLWGHHLFKKGPLLTYLNICFQKGFTHLTRWVLVLGGCWDNGEILCWFKKCLSRISR